MPSHPILILFVGLLSGFVSALFGIGGGIISVPALHLFCKFPLKRAVGTSIVSVAFVALVGVTTEFFVRKENLNFEVAAVLAVGGILGSFLGKSLFVKFPDNFFRALYAALLLITAMRLVGMFQWISSPPFSWENQWTISALLGLGIGFFAGVSSTLFGIGGGVVAVPFLLILFQGFGFHSARATALIMIFPTALVGIWHHKSLENIDWKTAFLLALPAMLGSVVGIYLVQEISSDNLKGLFAVLLALTAWRILKEGYGNKKPEENKRGT